MDANFKKEVVERSLNDIKVELDEEFDRNFERKAFFTDKWPGRSYDDGKGSLMVQSGGLRRSINSKRTGTQLRYGSSKPYARIHNEGGKIQVTKKMKGYFWARHKETTGKVPRKKDGTKRGTKRNVQLSDDALFYKSMALKKEGTFITIPQRRFIGKSPETDKIIREIAAENIEAYFSKHNLFEQ